MREVKGNIWELASNLLHDAVVIPTNQGYTKHGRNPMGAGLARQASDLYPSLQVWYGDYCMQHKANTPVVAVRLPSRSGGYRSLILFPTKPFDAENPQLSWRQDSSLPLIERGLQQLAALSSLPGETIARVLVPLLGCGNGKLQPGQVTPLMDRYLADPKFVRVLPNRMKRS